MNNKLRIYFLLILLASLPPAVYGKTPECSVCGKKIRSRYIKSSDNRIFCQQQCFEKILPRCDNCHQVCRGSFLRNEQNTYCSQKCAEAHQLPHCRNCAQPFRRGKAIPTAYGVFNYCIPCSGKTSCLVCERPEKHLRRLPNANWLCRQCDRDVVTSLPELERLLRKVRKTLHRHLQYPQDHPILLEMRTLKTSPEASREFGLYKYSGREIITKPLPVEFWREQKATVRYENEKCQITVMDFLPRIKAEEVLAHELAHDYMHHRWRYIKSSKIREGYAELIAAEYNRLAGHSRWNFRMQQNPDKIYGDGYRLLKSWLDKGSWREVFSRLDAINAQDMPSELKN